MSSITQQVFAGKALKRFFKTGTNHAQSNYEFIKIYATNATVFVTLIAGLSFTGVIFFEDWVLSLYPLSGVLASAFAVYLNALGKHRSSRYLIALYIPLANTFCHAHAVAPGEAVIPSFYLSQFAFSMIAWVVFDMRERRLLFSAIAINMAFIVLQPLTNQLYNLPESSSLATNQLFNVMVYLVSVFSLISCLASLLMQNQRSESAIIKQSEEIQEQNEALETQQGKLQIVLDDVNLVLKEAVDSGNFKARIDVEKKEGKWKVLSQSINALFDSISTPATVISAIVDRMVTGDLTHRYETEAKGDILLIKNSFNLTLNNLNALLLDILRELNIVTTSTVEMRASTEEMKFSAEEISASIHEMSSGSQSQVLKVDESSALMEVIVKSSDDMGQQAQRINEKARLGVDMSGQGTSLIEKVGSDMQEILQNSEATSASVDALTQRSQEITRILSIIKEIAAQTNLLALNAAIEAAQAGDAGRGFAVVANEIRKLAEASDTSVKEIEQIISSIQEETTATSQLMQQMKENVQAGEKATQTGISTFQKIEAASKDTLDWSEKIVTTTHKQTTDLKNIMSIIEGIVVIAEESAAGAAEVAASSAELTNGMDNHAQKSQEVIRVLDRLKSQIAQYQLAKEQES